MMDECWAAERKNLLFHLLDAVKQCQLTFSAKRLLATESDESVKVLCSTFENVFQHGLKEVTISQSSLRQFTDVTGLSKLTSMLLPSDGAKGHHKSTFWSLVNKHLSHHELERFTSLKSIRTDLGRVRAWFRASLNEHSLEGYLHSVINDGVLLKSRYEMWSFMLDDEKVVTLPNLAAGLSTILFALSIDKKEFNGASQCSDVTDHMSNLPVAIENSEIVSDVRSIRKKKQPKVINFDNDNMTNSISNSLDKTSDKIYDKLYDCREMSDNNQHSVAEDFISPNLPSDGSEQQHSDVFSFEDEGLHDHNSHHSKDYNETSRVSLSKSEPNLKEFDCARDGLISRCRSFSKQSSLPIRNLESCLVPINDNGQLINIGALKLVDPETTSESYGSFDSQEISYSEVLKQTLQRDDKENHSESSLSADGHMKLDDAKDDQNSNIAVAMTSRDESPLQNKHPWNVDRSTNEPMKMSQVQINDGNSNRNYEKEMSNLQKENSLLKDQLRSYIEAMKILEIKHKEESKSGNKSCDENSSDVKEYEQKLIHIAEMHGELMEFTERIHKKLIQKENQLEQTTRELSVLKRSLRNSYSWRSVQQPNNMINIIIPSAFLHGSPPHSYHIYQIYIKIRNEEWNVYRRYTEFYDLHCKLKKIYKNIKNLDFPPKKVFGKKNPKLVEERRRKLEIYLRRMVQFVCEQCSQLAENPSKRVFIVAIPFFSNETRSWNIPGQSPLGIALSNQNGSHQSYSGL